MIERIITSKTRVKILKLFLTHIDNRYYLRELERKLDESLSPLRRQLVKLERMEILVTEQEANLKYYRLNKNFTGMEELRRLVLGSSAPAYGATLVTQVPLTPIRKLEEVTYTPQPKPLPKRIKYDVAILTVVSLVILSVSIFSIYTSNKTVKQVAALVSDKTKEVADFTSQKLAEPTRPGEMVSRRWKVLPGSVPALSSGETGGRRSEEL